MANMAIEIVIVKHIIYHFNSFSFPLVHVQCECEDLQKQELSSSIDNLIRTLF